MRIDNLPAIDVDYGEAEARQALATADAFVLEGLGSGGGGGGGSTSATTIAQGIDLSADIASLLEAITEIDTTIGDNADVASSIGTISAKLRSALASLATITTTLANMPSQGAKATANAMAVSPATDSAPFPTNALTDAQLRATPVPMTQPTANAAAGIDESQNLQAVLADVADLLTSLGNSTTVLPGGIANTNLHGKLMVMHKAITDILSMLNGSALGGVGSLQIVPASGAVFNSTGLTDAQLRANPVEMAPASGSTFTTNSLTDTQLRATPVQTVPGAGAVFATNALTDAQLRAAAVAIKPESGLQFVTNALTDVQLRASAVPVSHNGLTDVQLRAAPVAVAWTGSMNVSTDGLTNSQLRATPVPVSHSGLTNAELRAAQVPVIGPLTNAELLSTTVAVSATALPLPAGAATSASQSTTNASLASLDGKLPTLGTKAPAGSVSVTPASASDFSPNALTNAQLRASALPVSISGMGPTVFTSAFSVTSASASQMTSAFGANSKLFSLMVQNLGSVQCFLQLHSSNPATGA
ncbi:MAG: hypothetical protein ACRCVX_06830, partial [Shewanella sp.]